MRFRPIATACVLAGLAILFYAFRISAPPLTPAESMFDAQAQTVGASHTPLFVRSGDQWLQPAAVYAGAVVRAAGGEELSVRLASAVMAALSVGLTFLIAQHVTGSTWMSVLAALLLMITPAFWSFAQLGTDALFPVPFILLWIANLLRFLKADSGRALSVAALALGVSIYTHPAAPLTAMFLWSMTLLIARRRNLARLATATALFGAAWIPAAVWFARHFDTYGDTFGRWFVFAAHLRNPVDGVRAFMNPGTLGNRASMYWGFWDPSWLFFSTPESAAPLLMVAAPLIAFGVARAVKVVTRDVAAVVVGTALAAPLAGASFGVPHYLADAAAVLPILAILSALGVAQLIAPARRRPLQDDVAVRSVDRWDDDHGTPRA